MRIGLFTDAYHPAVNGISYAVDTTRAELEKLGHTVYVFAPAPSIRYKETDNHIIRFPAIKGIVYKENMTSLYFPPSQVKKIDQLNLDIIHFFSPFQVGLLGAYVAIKNNTPLIGQYCTDAYQYYQYYPHTSAALIWLPAALPLLSKYPARHWRDIIKKILTRQHIDEEWRQRVLGQALRIAHDQCDWLIAPSKKMSRQLRAFGISKPIITIPNGVDSLPVDRIQAKKYATLFDVQPNHKVILYVGRLGKEKNIELLIKAFDKVAEKLPQAKLLICGDFDYRESLETLASSMNNKARIVFCGMIPHEKLGSIYSLADIFAFPSITDTQGLVLHEATHAGLPVVMVDKDITAVVDDGVNGLFARNNPKDFSQKLIKLLEADRLRKRMGRASKKMSSSYTAKKQAKELEILYKKASTLHQ